MEHGLQRFRPELVIPCSARRELSRSKPTRTPICARISAAAIAKTAAAEDEDCDDAGALPGTSGGRRRETHVHCVLFKNLRGDARSVLTGNPLAAIPPGPWCHRAEANGPSAPPGVARRCGRSRVASPPRARSARGNRTGAITAAGPRKEVPGPTAPVHGAKSASRQVRRRQSDAGTTTAAKWPRSRPAKPKSFRPPNDDGAAAGRAGRSRASAHGAEQVPRRRQDHRCFNSLIKASGAATLPCS